MKEVLINLICRIHVFVISYLFCVESCGGLGTFGTNELTLNGINISPSTQENLNEKPSCGTDFYWRDYDGRIPADAIPAGNDTNGLSYIGQAYIHHYGLLLGTILPGKMNIEVPCYGVVETDLMIKILCAADISKFHWVPTTLDSFKIDMREQCPILGGHDRKAWERINVSGKVNIGRTRQQGNVIIGNVASYDKREVWFYYPYQGNEMRASHFEVLVYRGDATLDLKPVVTEAP